MYSAVTVMFICFVVYVYLGCVHTTTHSNIMQYWLYSTWDGWMFRRGWAVDLLWLDSGR